MRLNVIEKGKGFPIVFGHSYLWDASMWEPQINELSKNYRCLVVELWNHGKSPDVSKSPYSIEEMAEDYHKTIKDHGVSEFAFVGLSVGGMIGVEIALRYPEAIKALVVSGSYVGKEPENTLKEYLGLMDKLDAEKKISQEFASELATYFFTKETFKSNPQLVNHLIQILVNYPSNKISGLTTIGRAIFKRKDKIKDLSKIKCPTLYMVGDQDSPRPPKESEEMAKATPNAQCVVIQKGAHVCNLEQPIAYTKHLKEFLSSALDYKAASGY